MFGNADVHGPSQEACYRGHILRVGGVHQRQLGRQAPHGHGRLHEEGIVRHDRDALRHEVGRDFRTFRIVANEDGDIAILPSRVDDGPDTLQDRLHLSFRVVAELDVHGTIGLLIETDLLVHVLVNPTDFVAAQNVVQLLCRIGEEGVVELYDCPAGAVVAVQNGLGAGFQAELPLQTGVQQVPVRTPPAVDGLFHIAHDQVVKPAGLAVLQQRTEVLPLDRGRVLELVQKEVLETDAQFLVHERGVGTIDDVLEDGIGVLDGDDVFLPLHLLEGLPEFPGDAESIDLCPDKTGGRILLETLSEQVAEGAQRPFKVTFQLHTELVLGLREPL